MSRNDETSPAITVVPLLPESSTKAAAMLAQAFCDDPIQVAFNPDPVKRAEALPLMFGALIRGGAASGLHLTTTPDFAAAAVWSPPGIDLGTIAVMRAYGIDLFRMLFRLPLSTIPATFSMFATMARRRKAHVPEPHWYLTVWGVDPSRQGEGLGTALVREGLHRVDAVGARAYLETETEGNVRFYERLGFAVVEEIEVTPADLPMWLMRREVA